MPPPAADSLLDGPPTFEKPSAPSRSACEGAGSHRSRSVMNDSSARFGPDARPANGERRPPTAPALPGPEADDEISLADLLAVLRREWKLILAALLVVFAAVAAYTFTRVPVYEASSVVLVDTGNKQGWTYNTGGIDALLSFGAGNRTLYNEVEILRQSVPLAERVGARLLEEGAGPTALTASEEGEPRPAAWVGRAILGRHVRFAPVSERADLVTITASSTAPAEAAAIANLYAEEYLEQSRERSRASVVTSRSFLEEQERARREELSHIEDDLGEFMAREGAIALDTEGQAAVHKIAALDAAIEEARVELEMERTVLTELERQLAAVEPGLSQRVASGLENEIGALQARIAELELEASASYEIDPSLRGEEGRDPELARTVARIAELRRQVNQLAERYVEEVLAVGGVEPGAGGASALAYASQLRRQIAEKRIAIQGHEARLGVLRGQLGTYEARLRDLPRQTIEVAQLQRQRKAAEQTYLFLVEKLQEARVAEEAELGYVQLIRQADVPGRPVRPRTRLNLLVGLVLGLLGGIGLALLKRALDHRLRSPEDLRAHGFSVLGVVPNLRATIQRTFGGKEDVVIGQQVVHASIAAGLLPLSAVTEAFRHIRTSIRFSRPDERLQALMVTSAEPADGKTTTAMSLALSMALAGQRVLLVDADLRRPAAHEMIRMPRHRGLTELLFQTAPADWDSYRRRLLMQWEGFEEEVEGLYVIPAGKSVPNPPELLGSRRFRERVQEMREAFDVIIFDSPPVLSTTDPVLVATLCDAVVMVASAGKTNWDMLRRAREHVEVAGAPVIGTVLNRFDGKHGYGHGYGYGYGYGYGHAENAEPARAPEGVRA